MDDLQRYGKCCGRTGPTDWVKNSFIEHLNLTNPVVLPCSCFSSYRLSFNSSWCADILSDFLAIPNFGQGNGSYEQGCKEKLSDWLQENALTIVAMDFSLMLTQVLQFVLALYFYRTIGQKSALKQTDSLIDPDPAHHNHTPDSEPEHGEENSAYMHPEDSGYIASMLP
ncbi:hypothetical protein LDENG_00220920 [Lucifuga dentata]|nr:hypothetical protein LDENG_00220920 [Lucifuga dentata]